MWETLAEGLHLNIICAAAETLPSHRSPFLKVCVLTCTWQHLFFLAEIRSGLFFIERGVLECITHILLLVSTSCILYKSPAFTIQEAFLSNYCIVWAVVVTNGMPSPPQISRESRLDRLIFACSGAVSNWATLHFRTNCLLLWVLFLTLSCAWLYWQCLGFSVTAAKLFGFNYGKEPL